MESGMGHEDEPVLRLRVTDLASRSFSDETVVLDLRSSRYLAANPSASLLWRELEQGATRTRLIEALLSEFEVERDLAEADVDAFIADCKQRGLLS